MKKWWAILGSVLVGLICLQLWLLRGTPGEALRTEQLRSDISYSDVPTLLVPGWGGNGWTYSKLIKYYQKENIAQKTMTIHVTPTGKVKVQGSVANKKNALIQLIFDWNYTKDYQPQTKWLQQVLTVLHRDYHVDKLNVIAHSWGGSALIHALANSSSLQKEIAFPKVILLGTPIDESVDENTSYAKAQAKASTDKNYQRLLKKFKEFDPLASIDFYNLMGSVDGEKTDGSVPNVQSLFLKNIIHPNWSKYYQAVYTNTDHTDLHQSAKVLDTMDKILWNNRPLAWHH